MSRSSSEDLQATASLVEAPHDEARAALQQDEARVGGQQLLSGSGSSQAGNENETSAVSDGKSNSSTSQKEVSQVKVAPTDTDEVDHTSTERTKEQGWGFSFGEDPGEVPHEGALGFSNIEPVHASVCDLSVTVGQTVIEALAEKAIGLFKKAKSTEPKESTILHDINVDVPVGNLCAIIGGSGSGKTTLLNVMAQRMGSSNMSTTGAITYNGQTDINRVRNAYVLQQDVLQPTLTCIETLRYAAELRLPRNTSAAERETLVNNVILELGLKECANTLVGDSMHKGLSGGEKRRLSIGIQLLANPSLLFLDEPTTGLDAHSAFLLVQTCRRLAHKGRTLVMSIHQPRSDIFFLFDSVVVLSRGQTVYSGPTSAIVDHFQSLGYPFPEHMNPADHIIDLAAVDTRTPEQEEESSQRVQMLVDAWKSREAEQIQREAVPVIEPQQTDGETVSARAPLSRQISVQIRRTLLISLRDPLGYAGLLIECAAMGIICGWVFYKPDGSLAGIRTTQGLLYTACAAQGYLILLYETYRLCRSDLKVFDREHNEGCVGPTSFLVSRRLAKVLTEDLYVPLIFSVIVYFMVGLRTDGARYFFVFFANVLIQQHIAVAFATVCAGISRDFTTAVLVANLGYTLQSMACGFFVNAAHMPVYVRWTRWIAYVYYGFGAMISNQFNGYMGDCPYDASSSLCYEYSGEYVLDTLGFPYDWITVPLCVNVGWTVGFWLVSYALLKYVRVTVNVSKKQKTTEAAEAARVSSNTGAHKAHIKLDVLDLRLEVERRSGLKMQKRVIPILNGITANFVPGSINAILGPSGSGKSSLLNWMADRLHSSATQSYKYSGTMTFNGQVPSRSLSRSLCSYVTQEDDGLMPALTVRETLYFAAELRLPRSMSMSEKKRRADDVILQMGLRDCADTLIGDEFVKGISGGEKRRVTISIQLLSDPKILLLDEPTSGLDAFTAASILQVLKELAEDGRTVICTIHQPRSDLFTQFGLVLLLAKGGRVAYNGPCANMMDYFSGLGYPTPLLTNPADHFLDLISVNLQSSEKETESRMRVDAILDAWRSRSSGTPKTPPEPADALRDETAALHALVRDSASFVVAYPILLRRNIVNFSRSPHMIVARIMQVVGIGIVFCLFFAPLKDDYIGVINRLGFVQEITALYFVGMLNNMAIYPSDRAVFYREHDDRLYGVSAFFMVYLTLELPFEIVTSLIFSIFMVVIPGLNRSAEMFFATAYCVLAIVNCGESIGIAFNTLFKHEGFAVNLISVVLSVGSFMAGIMSLNMPGFLKGVNWLSPLKYGVAVVINMAFEGEKFSCDGQVTDSNGGCAFDTGEKVLQNYGLESDVPAFLGALAAAVVIYRLVAYAILKLVRLQRGMKRSV